MIKVITVTTDIEATQPLINSLDKQGWDKAILEIPEWKGFGSKLLTTYAYLKNNPEVDRFIFVDAFDVISLGAPDEFIAKVKNIDFLVSAERGCWPVAEWDKLYANKFEHGFNYVNSGLYYAKSQAFIDLFDFDPPQYETDDQMWLSKHYLDEGVMIKLDTDCDVFQSYSFIRDEDYQYTLDKRLYNNWTKTFPCFVHGNGRSDISKIHQLIA